MKIEININYAETLSKSENLNNTMYLKTWTDMGSLNIPFDTLLQITTWDELYRIPGVVKCVARYFRGKDYYDLCRSEKQILNNIPLDLKDTFHDWTGAAVITEILARKFADDYEKFYKVFDAKSIEVMLPGDINNQVGLYRKLKRELKEGKLIERKPSYKDYLLEMLDFFSDDVKLLCEVCDE